MDIMENKETIGKEIFDNIGYNGEFILHKNGVTGVRQKYSRYIDEKDEEQIVLKLDLSFPYWSDTLDEWGINIQEEIPEDTEKEFIQSNILPYLDFN